MDIRSCVVSILNTSLHGYKGIVAEKLSKIGAEIGDRIIIRKKNVVVEGILMPRQELYSDRPIVVVKLDNGYNIGIRVDSDTVIE